MLHGLLIALSSDSEGAVVHEVETTECNEEPKTVSLFIISLTLCVTSALSFSFSPSLQFINFDL